MDNKLLKVGDLVLCVTRYTPMKTKLNSLGYDTELIHNESIKGCVALRITGIYSPVQRRGYHVCRECKFLTNEHKSIGYRCIRPNWHWRSETAMWKSPTARTCIAFIPKEGRDV